MSAVSQIDFSLVATSRDQQAIRELLNSLFWDWFDANRDMEVKLFKWWIFKSTYKLHEFETIFTLIFGKRKAVS